MFECRHNSDEGTGRKFSESQHGEQFFAASDLSLQIDSQSETAVEAELETDCLDGICSLTWTPGSRH